VTTAPAKNMLGQAFKGRQLSSRADKLGELENFVVKEFSFSILDCFLLFNRQQAI